MELKNRVIAALRLSTTDEGILSEVDTLIAAAVNDLRSTGITNEADPLFELAVITYAKANFGFDNPEAERLNMSYEFMKQKMMSTREYIDARTT